MKQINYEAIQMLRRETKAGIVDCRNALSQAEGDMEAARELLLRQGFALTEKKAERVAADGAAYAAVINGVAVLLEVNTETDFVAVSPAFRENLRAIAETIAACRPVDMESLLRSAAKGKDGTVELLLQRMTLAFREKIVLRRFAFLEGPMTAAYTHGNGQYGVILALESQGAVPEAMWQPVAKELTLQIAASAPVYVSREGIGEEGRREIERSIAADLEEDAAIRGKPQAVREKILSGRVEKFYRTHCLLEQPAIRDAGVTVGGFLERASRELGRPLRVRAFCRYEKAEGLQDEEYRSNLEYARSMANCPMA